MLMASVANMATMWSAVARTGNGRVERWPDAIAIDAGAPNPVLNRTLVTASAFDAAALAARARDFYGVRDLPWGIMDPWESADLRPHGFTERVRLPCMVRDPAPASPAAGRVRIERVEDAAGLALFKRILFEGFTMVPWPDDHDSIMTERWLGEPGLHLFVGSTDRGPAGCSVALVAEGIVGVYMVAVLPAMRGRGVGEAVSWAATLADPSLPAVLQASDMGRPIYDRMGYRTIGTMQVWLPLEKEDA